MAEKEYNFDDIVQKAFEQRDSSESQASSQCLSDQTLKRLYSGQLPDSQRQKALQHLDKCEKCSADLALYAELVENEQQLAAERKLAAKLKRLKDILPRIAGHLNKWDFSSVCQAVNSAVNRIKNRTSLKTVDALMENLLSEINSRLPQLALHTRGQDQVEETPQEGDIDDLCRQLTEQIKTVGEYPGDISRKQARSSAYAELKLLNGLDESLHTEAVTIRDACQQYYEKKYLSGEMPQYISYGSTHARQMLVRYIQLADILGENFSDKLVDFIVYCSMYCYDLGMSDLEEDFAKLLHNRGLKTRKILLPDAKSGCSGLWQQLGFKSQKIVKLVADVCCFDSLKKELPESQPVFFKGQTRNFPSLAVAALIKILDLLSTGPYRLLQPEAISVKNLPAGFLEQYLKHELIREVSIEREYIAINVIVQYDYPFDEKKLRDYLERILAGQFKHIEQSLKYVGLKLPPVRLEVKQALFKRQHPLHKQMLKLSIDTVATG